jgi:hypothetical protein
MTSTVWVTFLCVVLFVFGVFTGLCISWYVAIFLEPWSVLGCVRDPAYEDED